MRVFGLALAVAAAGGATAAAAAVSPSSSAARHRAPHAPPVRGPRADAGSPAREVAPAPDDGAGASDGAAPVHEPRAAPDAARSAATTTAAVAPEATPAWEAGAIAAADGDGDDDCVAALALLLSRVSRRRPHVTAECRARLRARRHGGLGDGRRGLRGV